MGQAAPARQAPDAVTPFAAALDRAMATRPAPAPGPLTLGQMLDVYAGPAAGVLAGPVGPAPAPVGVAAPAVPAPNGHDLGVGPVARPLAGAIGSGHGMRVHPVHGDARMHHGIDVAATAGTPIQAFAGGTVTFAGVQGGYGNVVIIEHANGVSTRYAHQSAIEVVVGQPVTAGEVVGRVGATGTATGPHLHFELRRGDTSIDPVPHLP